MTYGKSVAEQHDVSLDLHTRSHRVREQPRRYNDGFIYTFTGSRDAGMSPDYKVSLYFPVLDCFLLELKQSFTDRNE